MLTGFHGFHVMLGTTMLFVMRSCCFDGAFFTRQAFRVRGSRLVLALCRCGMGWAVYIRLYPLTTDPVGLE